MANENAQLAEFAENLWKNYLQPKVKEEGKDVLTFYRAVVVSNDGNNRLTIQKPFDDSYQVACTDSMADATEGMQVIVIRFGSGANNKNHIVFAKGDGNPLSENLVCETITLGSSSPIDQWSDLLQLLGTQSTGKITVQSTTTSWKAPSVYSSSCTIVHGGYYSEGKHVYVQIQLKLSATLAVSTERQIFSSMPVPAFNTALAVYAASKGGAGARIDASGNFYLVSSSAQQLTSSNTIIITGHYTAA